MVARFCKNYLERHENRANQFLHVLGVPASFGLSVYFLIEEQWLWAAGAFLGGYVLQFIGHAVEGNDAGEVILVKKLLGKPYTEFGTASKSKQPKFDD